MGMLALVQRLAQHANKPRICLWLNRWGARDFTASRNLIVQNLFQYEWLRKVPQYQYTGERKRKIMLKRFYAIFASTFLVFMPLVGHLAQRVDNDFVVLGQVIDSLGKPVEGAIITLDTPPGADITFRTKSSRDGSFTLYDTFVQSLEKRRLYVAGPEPKGAFLLLTPPFAYTPPWFPLREVGHEITSKSGSKIDVGKIAVQIKYSE